MKGKISVITLFLLLAVGAGHAQQLSDYERLRMENIRLRQENESLKSELSSYRRSNVVDVWEGLSGLNPDEDPVEFSTGGSVAGKRRTAETGLAREVEAAVPFFTLPYNELFEPYIERYTITRRKSMPYVLGRYYMYLPMFASIFAEYGVPEELTALCIVESAVSQKALSPAGALGMWQLMPETARGYGLVVDGTKDERLDIRKSTVVAARVLRDLKKSLGTWELAVFAYNCGSGNVRKAIIRCGGSKDVWAIYDYLPEETRAYLPSFVAAAYCVRYHQNYSIEARQYVLPKYDSYVLKKDASVFDVATVTGDKVDILLSLNCQYLRGVIPANGTITLPNGKAKALEAAGF